MPSAWCWANTASATSSTTRPTSTTRSKRCGRTWTSSRSASTRAWAAPRPRCAAPSRTARWCATTPTTTSRASSRCRSRCSTTSTRGWCCRASTIATRRACTPRRCTTGTANWSFRPRRPKRCASRCHPQAAASAPSIPPEMASGGRPRAGYLGPEGTFSEEALLASALPEAVEPIPLASVYEVVMQLRAGELEWALVPVENSLDGSLSVTLDLLAELAGDIAIVGEALLRVRHSLIAGEAVSLADIDTVLSHPLVPGQCERFLRGELGHARVLAASSTAEAVRLVASERKRNQAALGTVLAAEIYGATVLREGVEDSHDNETRFLWLAQSRRAHLPPPPRGAGH